MATLAKPLNDLGRNHWEKFASANYFDESGLFVVSIYALPLVFNSFVTLVRIYTLFFFPFSHVIFLNSFYLHYYYTNILYIRLLFLKQQQDF